MLGMIGWLIGAAGQATLPPEQYHCVIDALASHERMEIGRTAQRGEAPAPAMRSRLLTVVGDCGARYGWDDDRSGAMVTMAAAAIVRGEVEPALLRQGIDPALIERWLARQNESVQTQMPLVHADVGRLFAELAQAGVPSATLDANGGPIGVLLGTLIAINRLNRGLPL